MHSAKVHIIHQVSGRMLVTFHVLLRSDITCAPAGGIKSDKMKEPRNSLPVMCLAQLGWKQALPLISIQKKHLQSCHSLYVYTKHVEMRLLGAAVLEALFTNCSWVQGLHAAS
ncbi:hypothetical protein INR49_028249 [Caranx melampygus]|nr:hypothetical protein INR49_028249 [Caranx melampygus]